MKTDVKKNLSNAGAAAFGSAIGVVASEVDILSAEMPSESSELSSENDASIEGIVEQNEDSSILSQPGETDNLNVNSADYTSNNTSVYTTQNDDSSSVDVLSYDRIPDGYGGQVDLAVVAVDGNIVEVVDTDLDGFADAYASDINGDNMITQDEVCTLNPGDLAMQEFMELAPATEQLAMNETMPDYVNDADVDTFMA